MDDSTVKIEGIQVRLKNVREKKLLLLEQSRETAGIVEGTEELVYASFYVWLGIMLKVKPMLVQFWLSVFPAIFIDVIAPLSISISLFLNNFQFNS